MAGAGVLSVYEMVFSAFFRPANTAVPQLCLMFLCSVYMEFKVGEVIDQRNAACIV